MTCIFELASSKMFLRHVKSSYYNISLYSISNSIDLRSEVTSDSIWERAYVSSFLETMFSLKVNYQKRLSVFNAQSLQILKWSHRSTGCFKKVSPFQKLIAKARQQTQCYNKHRMKAHICPFSTIELSDQWYSCMLYGKREFVITVCRNLRWVHEVSFVGAAAVDT